HLRALQTAPGIRRLPADRVRRLRHSLGELRAHRRYAPGEADSPEHRHVPPPTPTLRRDVRLAPRAVDDRSRLLQVDAVALPAALQGWPRGQTAGGGELVPGVQD